MSAIIPVAEVASSPLIVDAIYEGGKRGDLTHEAIHALLGVQNLGGFRFLGRGEDRRICALNCTGDKPDWPDHLDHNTGQLIYYGDNKEPGLDLNHPSREGNAFLRRVFDHVHADPPRRQKVPPIFIFNQVRTSSKNQGVQFKGLAVPGYPSLPATEDLVAVWKTSRGERFQNYRSIFTILNATLISRKWIEDLKQGRSLTENTPNAWLDWVHKGSYKTLISEPTTVIRTIEEQMPDTPLKEAILRAVFTYYSTDPYEFELFAARIFQLLDNRVIIDEVTRRSVDGGRDAIGRYLLGVESDPIYSDFALEAKCYAPSLNGSKFTSVGVKDASRLISRLKHRQFGVLVTTSAVARQAYQEVREDGHPIIFISGRDIAEILIKSGYTTVDLVMTFLKKESARTG